jgi:hypothetical protein
VAEAAGDEALGAAHVEDAVVPAGRVRAGEEHQVVAGEVAERHFRQPGQGGGSGEDDAQVQWDGGAEPQFGGVDGVVHESDVQAAGGQQPQLLRGGDLLQVDGELRSVLRTGGQQGGQDGGGGVGRHARAQGAEAAVGGAAGQGAQPLLPGEEFVGLFQQRRSGGAEPDAALRAVEQFGSEFLLQPADRLAERRLGHAQPLGGPAEVQLVGHGDEKTQVAQEIHDQGSYPEAAVRGWTGRPMTGNADVRGRAVTSTRTATEDRIRQVFAEAGARGQLHAVPVRARTPAAGEDDDGRGAGEIAVGADDAVVIASIFKVLLVLEFARQAVAGQLDPRERVRVTSADRLGGWGTAGCLDDVELSLRDLAHFAMSVSDNSAADLLLDRVGLDTVRLLAK